MVRKEKLGKTEKGKCHGKFEKKRYSALLGSNVFVGCKHQNTWFSCCKIPLPDALYICELLFSLKDKISQDSKVAGWVYIVDVKQRRRRYTFKRLTELNPTNFR